MSQYIVKHGVPVLDEHDLTDDDGNVTGRVDRKRLEVIAGNNNRRVKETGDFVPLVIGHTKDGIPEHRQPKIVGWARNFKVRKLARTGRYAIHADFHFDKDKYHLAKDYPRRSVELWTDRWEMDPISLLGATTPERDLGVLKYERTGSPHRYSRVMEDSPMPDPNAAAGGNDDLVQKVLDAFCQSKYGKFIEMLMQQSGADEQGGEPAPAEGQDDLPTEDEPPMEGEGDATAPEGGFGGPEGEEEPPVEDEDEPKKYSAAGGSPTSGSNTFTPSFGDKKRMQRDQARVTKVRYAREVAGLKGELADLRRKYARTARERDLIQLEAEGYEFDRLEELDLVAPTDSEPMADSAYKSHLGRIRKRYQRAPIGGGHPRVREGDNTGGRSKEDMLALASYAQSEGITYEEALRRQGGAIL
jgi:hypothetical protein